MTYLDLVNNVLRRMRANTVESIGQNDQSRLVGDIINDAKRQVEDSWDWQCLRETISVPIVSGTQTYSLTGSQNRATIFDIWNTSPVVRLNHRSQNWGRSWDGTNAVAGQPLDFSVEGVDASGDTQIQVYPSPDASYNLNAHVVQRQADLEAEGDILSIPHMPVLYLAYAMASREEGESGGAAAAELFGVASRMLSDAIAQDSALNPSDLVFYEV